MILNEDFDTNLTCNHKYYCYWWHKIRQEEPCMVAIERAILNIPLENFELCDPHNTIAIIKQCVEMVLKQYKVKLDVRVERGRYWYNVIFMKESNYRHVTFAHLFLNERE